MKRRSEDLRPRKWRSRRWFDGCLREEEEVKGRVGKTTWEGIEGTIGFPEEKESRRSPLGSVVAAERSSGVRRTARREKGLGERRRWEEKPVAREIVGAEGGWI